MDALVTNKKAGAATPAQNQNPTIKKENDSMDILAESPARVERYTVDKEANDLTSDEWLSVHPEVATAAPGWANSITATDDGPQVAISYDRTIGSLEIGVAAVWEDEKVRFPDSAPAYVYFHANENAVTAADLRQFAAEFTAAADALEAVAK